MNILSFVIGFFAGIFIAILSLVIYFWFKNRKKEFKILTTDKELLNQILPYISENKELELFAKELYEKIYEDKKIRIDKKRLMKMLSEIKNDKR